MTIEKVKEQLNNHIGDSAVIKCNLGRNKFEKYDVILGPAAHTTAPKLGESLSDPIKMYLGDIYTISVNLAGLPGICVPCGDDKNGLPIGVQLIGDSNRDYYRLQTLATDPPAKMPNDVV